MSTNPPESSSPAVPDAAGGVTSAAPAGEDQAKADAGAVGAAALKGAATGGVAGAAAGALKGAVKTKTGRYVLLATAAAPILVAAMLADLVFSANQSSNAIPAGRAVSAQSAALASFTNKDELKSIQNAASQAGVPWEILAAIEQSAKSRSGDKGTGPFGIDMSKVNGGITEADANNFDKAALYVARQLAKASQGTVDSLPNPSLDAGYMDTRGDKGQNVLKPSPQEDSVAVRGQVKTQYVAAISAVPIKDGATAAESIFSQAGSFATGASNKCGTSSLGVGVGSSVSPDAKMKTYAQAIINQVAAKGMPENAAVIAVATALQESGLQMYWNAQVPGSQDLSDGGPEGGHDLTDGRISYSVGLFQQQVNGSSFSWGTVQDAMNPTKSADMFLERLLTITGWQDMAVTAAAQTVQGSAFPDAYAAKETEARALVAELKPATGTYGATTATPAGKSTVVTASSISCLSGGIGTGVAGNGDDYPFKNDTIDEADPFGTLNRECVSFVAWRMNVQMGWKEGHEYPFSVAKVGVGLFGDAVSWKDTVGSKFPMDHTPKVGAVAWFDRNLYLGDGAMSTGDAGHVAVVSAVKDNGTIDVEEYNFNSNHNYHARNIPVDWVSGFIHVADISK